VSLIGEDRSQLQQEEEKRRVERPDAEDGGELI